MGWTDDEIDDLFREASSHQKVGYNDAYWKEMETLLDAEKPAEKRLFWWLFGGVAVVLTIGTSYYFVAKQAIIPRTDTINAKHIEGNQERNAALTETIYTEDTLEEQEKISDVSTELNEKQFVSGQQKLLLKDQAISVSAAHHQMTQPAGTGNNVLFENAGDDPDKNTISVHEIRKSAGDQEDAPEVDDSIADNQFKEEVEDGQFLQPADETASLLISRSDDPVAQRRTGFYIGADAGAGTSYISSSRDLLTQWGIKAGFDYTLSNQFRLGIGLGFRQQLAKNLLLERSREYYSLGLINVSQSINYDRLQFADLNIHAHYLFRKIAIGIELTPSYLISARANMNQTQIENGKTMKGDVSMEQERQFVRTDNLNPFGIDAGISFQYGFKRQMYLELGINARLNKMLMSEDFIGKHTPLPFRLELGLIKRF